MKNKRVTVEDVARAAGVSMMTVSRAINGREGLSDETRERILALAQEMGYRPSQIARSLATRKTATLGLVIPDVANPFFAQIARGAEDKAFESGYGIFLINTAEDAEREKAALDSLWQKEIDGIILCSSRLDMDVLKPYLARFPAVVLVNREWVESVQNVASVNVEDCLGAQQATKYLAEGGRKRIAYIAGPATSISGQRRLEGYRLGLESSACAFDPALVEHSLPTTEGGHAAAVRLFARSPNVDAAFCFNDLVAVGVIQACQENGWNVPVDVAVIGADDIPLASLVTPRLSTLRVDQNLIGRMATSLVIDMITDPTCVPSHRIIQPELVTRQSS